MTAMAVTWKQRARKAVANILAELPDGATPEAKRALLRQHRPSQYDTRTWQRAWASAVKEALGEGVKRMPKGVPLPEVRADIPDATLYALLVAYREHPTEEFRRFVIADRLDELGQERRVRLVRDAKADAEAVAKRVWPGCRVVCVSGEGGREFASWLYRGNRCLMRLAQVEMMVAGRTLLIDPAVREAARVEVCRQVLAMFSEEVTDGRETKQANRRD